MDVPMLNTAKFTTVKMEKTVYGGKFECWEFYLQTDFLP